jgi:hypothetical protein
MKGDLFTENELAVLFNEWQRRYIENPKAFNEQWATIIEFLNQEAEGEEPDYGRDCVRYLVALRDEE